MKEKELKRQDMVFLLGSIVLILFSFWKARFGLGGGDEAFYLTIPYRMCQGDILLLHEWHVSQFSAFLLYPIMKVYLVLFEGTEGIILNFRYIYIFAGLVVEIIAYLRLRKKGIPSLLVTWMFFLFVPFNIMALSYNSMGMMLAFLCVVLLTTAKNSYTYVIAGILYAGVVLCQPLLVLVFFVSFAIVFIYAILKKKICMKKYLFCFLLGCMLAAIPVITYLMINLEFQEFIPALKGMMSDPEHGKRAGLIEVMLQIFNQYCPNFIINIGTGISFSINKIFVFLYAIYSIVWILIYRHREQQNNQSIALVISSGVSFSICGLYLLFIQNSYINYLLFPWFLHGIGLFYCLKEKEEKRKLILIYCFGIGHAIAFLGSNQYGMVFNLALFPAGLFSIMYSWRFLVSKSEEEKIDFRIKNVIFKVCIIGTICCLLYGRATHVFWQTKPNTLIARCEEGPIRGIYLIPEECEEFTENYKDLSRKDITNKDNVLFLTCKTWLCLIKECPLAQYSGWLSGINDSTFLRLKQYYKINPEKYPNKIYIEKKDVNKSEMYKWLNKQGYRVQESKQSYFLIKANAR